MRKRFSERYRFVKIRDSFQINSMDDGLKNRLWNIIKNIFIDTLETNYYDQDIVSPQTKEDKEFIVSIYDKFFKDNVDPLEYTRRDIRDDLKKRYFNFQWFDIYDFLEFLAEIYYSTPLDFYKKTNQVLEEEMSGYRFVDNYIAPIIDEIEIKEVESALESEYSGVRRHLSLALELLSDREKPDYINSIKESISAVEGVAQHLTGLKKDLGACVKVMKLDIQKQFIKTLSELYSWTSREDGIRHTYTGEELKTSFEEAKYMLVTCSAFVNYMIAKKGTE